LLFEQTQALSLIFGRSHNPVYHRIAGRWLWAKIHHGPASWPKLLKRWPSSPKVEFLVNHPDGFLYPNEVLRGKI